MIRAFVVVWLVAVSCVASGQAPATVLVAPESSTTVQVNVTGIPYAICLQSLTMPQLLAKLRESKAEMERDGTLFLLGYVDDNGDARALASEDLR